MKPTTTIEESVTFTPTSLEKLFEDVGPDVRKEMQRIEETYSLSRKMLHLRLDAGLTQEQMAKLMDCSQSRISKLENSDNSHISVEDFYRYVRCTQQRTTAPRVEVSASFADSLVGFLCSTLVPSKEPTNSREKAFA